MDEAQGNSNYALEKLRALLQSDSLDADGKLPTERMLSEILGVSRRSIRRALEVLEAEGRIWRRQGSGTFAGKRPDGWSNHVDSIIADTDLMEIMEVRLRVEPQLAQLAAIRAKAADIERMTAPRQRGLLAVERQRALRDGAVLKRTAHALTERGSRRTTARSRGGVK